MSSDAEAETKETADASSYGLGAVIMQKRDLQWKPIAYASRSMSQTEQRYAQIEKEALALTWACEKFTNYILGKRFQIETDHKPLVPLFSTKHLDDLPSRVLRFKLRLARYNYSIAHVPGKHLYTADTLSRAPLELKESDTELSDEADRLLAVDISNLPASKEHLEQYKNAQSADPVCSLIINYCCNGWPEKTEIDTITRPYWERRGNIFVTDSLLLYGSRIVVPKSLQNQTLRKIHDGHQGIVRCRSHAMVARIIKTDQ